MRGTAAPHDGTGGFVGGQTGYDWQISDGVLGLSLDGDWADIGGDRLCPNVNFTCGHEVQGLATLRGRLGTTIFDPQLLAYATGGGAWGRVHYDEYVTATGAGGNGGQPHATADHWGWVIGGGLEYAFRPGWSAKVPSRVVLELGVTQPPAG